MRILPFLLATVVLLLTPGSIFAQNEGGLTVNPAYVDVVIEEAAEEKEFEIEYTNNSSEAIELEIFPIDFHQTDERGVIGFLGEESRSYDYSLSSFLSFDTNIIQLAAGETKTLTAKVTNRLDLSPGGHYSAVVARLVIAEEEQEEGVASVAPAASTLVYLIKKGGEQYNLSLREIDWPNFPIVFSIPSTLILTFQNQGNVHMAPFGTVSIKDMFGREVYKGSINNSSFKVLPTSRRIIPGYITKLGIVAPISFMTMEVKGTDFGKNANFLIRESFIYINPWMFILPILIVVFIFWRKKKGLGRSKVKNQNAKV